MNFAGNLRTSVRGYLSHRSADRAALRLTIDSLSSRLPDTAIFGGMLREFALGNARTFSSDIDLVSLASREEIARAIAHLSPTRNKFGGFRFVAAKQAFDIWALEDTWAFREGLVTGAELSDLLKTTFFNVDASIYNLANNRCSYSDEWVAGIRNRILDINLVENPSPDRMVRRAITMACEKNFAIGDKLAMFLLEHVDQGNLNWISCLFMKSLRKHVESSKGDVFVFEPQHSLITCSSRPGSLP